MKNKVLCTKYSLLAEKVLWHVGNIEINITERNENYKNHMRILHKKKVTKGVRRMPWLSEAMKGVTSCEKLRGLANTN